MGDVGSLVLDTGCGMKDAGRQDDFLPSASGDQIGRNGRETVTPFKITAISAVPLRDSVPSNSVFNSSVSI
jgi:hypothetical protein